MLTLPAGVRIFAYTRPTDLRRSFDRLAAMVKDILRDDAQSGHLFLFRNRSGDRMKVLWHEPTGFWIFYKRLHRGTFTLPTSPGEKVEIEAPALALILEGLDSSRARRHA